MLHKSQKYQSGQFTQKQINQSNNNLKRLNQIMTSEQRLAPLMENSPILNVINENGKTVSNSNNINKKSSSKLYEYECLASVSTDVKVNDSASLKKWKNKSNENILIAKQEKRLVENEKLLNGEDNFLGDMQTGKQRLEIPKKSITTTQMTTTFSHELEKSKKYASNGSIKSNKNNQPELYSSVHQIDLSQTNLNKINSNSSLNNDTALGIK